MLTRFCSVYASSSIRCKNGMNHLRDRVPHMADGLCQYAHQYNNKVLICKVRLLFKFCSINHFLKKELFLSLKKHLIHFACPLFHITSAAMKEAERWLWCPRHQLPLITPGLDWPSMPGQGMLPFLRLYMNVVSCPFQSTSLFTPSSQLCVGVCQLRCDLPQQTVLGGKPGPWEWRCAVWGQTCVGGGKYQYFSSLSV